MNAIELLKADHKVVDGLFQKVDATDDSEHPALFEHIKAELETHTHIEETIFYPPLIDKGDDELSDLTKEGIEEHRVVKVFIREISALVDDSEKFAPKLTVLIENVKHHVMEEEGEMFKMVEDQFDAAQLEEWGAQMEAEKAKYQKTSAASGK